MNLDGVLRRYGVVLLIVTFPGLVLPLVAVAQNGDELSVVNAVVVGVGYVGALALYGGLAYLTVRAYKR